MTQMEIKPGHLHATLDDVVRIAQNEIGHLTETHVLGIFLDAAGRVMGIKICDDSINQILAMAKSVGAASIVVAHNHPKGNASPNSHEVDVMALVALASRRAGVNLAQVIIVTDDEIDFWTETFPTIR